jgi:hypothetical protein
MGLIFYSSLQKLLDPSPTLTLLIVTSFIRENITTFFIDLLTITNRGTLVSLADCMAGAFWPQIHSPV